MNVTDRLYEVERLLTVVYQPTRLADPQAYVDGIRSSLWYKNRHKDLSRRRITVVESNHVHAWADIIERKIFLPSWARCDLTVCHELAHIDSRDVEHGVRFRKDYHGLLGRFVGPDVARSFRHACKAVDLDF